MINTNIHLAILGFGTECSKKNGAIASTIGKLSAQNNISLVAGNVTSTFEYAFKAAKDFLVQKICVIEKHKQIVSNNYADEVIRTKDTHEKHKQIAQIADAAVLIGGGAGSQLLVKYFLKNKKTVVAIEGSGGLADSKLPPQVLYAKNAREAFKILNSIKKECILDSSLNNMKLSYDHFGLCGFKSTKEKIDNTCINKDTFAKQFSRYLKSNLKTFSGKLHLKGTDFQKKVWLALLDIPFGTTISYGELAEKLGDKKASRAVGHAAGQNPIWIIIPCHRLVGKGGDLTGYAGGLEMKMRLLDLENHQTELNLF